MRLIFAHCGSAAQQGASAIPSSNRAVLAIAVLLAATVVEAGAARAQSFPARPIRIMVSFPPGGAADLVARVVGQPLSARLGQPVIIENRPGSNGNLAGELTAHAAPDGYTLLLAPDSLFSINPHLYARMSIDPLKDLLPVSTVVANQLVLATNPTLVPAQTLGEFVAYVRRTQPPPFYASIGNGSQHHLAMELLKQQAGIDLVHVPFRGGGPAAIAVMGGDVAAMFGGGSIVPTVQAGRMRGLAVSGSQRSAALPELPTVAEFFPGFDVTIWQAFFAPPATPEAIVERLRAEVRAVLALPEVVDKLAASGSGDPYLTTPEQFAARMRADFARYGKVIRETGLRVE
jgi:tripartite-type tricarboxylate transporter receptor subunit TctC